MNAMEPVIQRIVLKGFRSIPAETISFDNPTIFVGRNGSGKSNLVGAFSFLSEAMSWPLQAVFERAGGIEAVCNRSLGESYPRSLAMRVDFGSVFPSDGTGFYAFEVKARQNYGFSVVREQCRVAEGPGCVWFDRDEGGFRSNVQGLDPALDAAALGLPVVGGAMSFLPMWQLLAGMRVYSIEPGKVRAVQEPDSGVALKRDGANVASVLNTIQGRSPANFERISEILSTIVPNTSRVDVRWHGGGLGLQFTLEWHDDRPRRLTFEGSSMSDGTLRAIGLLAAVFQTSRPPLIAVEEPEATIHPGALDAVLDLLLLASKQMQVVVTTHSPELLDAKWITERNLRFVEWREGATRVTPVSEANRQALQSHLMGAGDLLRSNALEPIETVDGKTDPSPLFEDLQ